MIARKWMGPWALVSQNEPMKIKPNHIASAALALFTSLTVSAVEDAGSTGLLVHNARGLTLDARGAVQRFDALAVDGQGRVVATGKLKNLQRLIPNARQLDAQG